MRSVDHAPHQKWFESAIALAGDSNDSDDVREARAYIARTGTTVGPVSANRKSFPGVDFGG